MFSPENLFDFSRVVKLWSSVQKSCITRNLEQSKEVRMSKGRSQVLRHLREMPQPFPGLHKTWIRSPLGQSLAKLHTLGQREPRIQMLAAGKQMQCQPLRPSEPSQRGMQWRFLSSIYWCFHILMFHGHSLEHFQYLLLNDTCDLWYLVLVQLETNQDPGGAGCAAGYAAPMCIQCNHDYFSHGQQCEPCRTSNAVSSAVVVAAVLALAGLGAALIWHRRNAEGHPTNPSCWTALTQQAKAQVPILLQLCGLAIAINLMEQMPWREWNEHDRGQYIFAAIEIGSWVVLCQWALLNFVVHLLSALLPAERPAVDHPGYVSKHAGSRRPGCQQAIGVLGVAIHPDTATLHLQLERHRELAMQVWSSNQWGSGSGCVLYFEDRGVEESWLLLCLELCMYLWLFMYMI